MDIVDLQFQDITLYDMQVQFDGGINADDQTAFKEEFSGDDIQIGFSHQSSVELTHNGNTWNIYMLSGKDGFERFYDLHSDETSLSKPKVGEALLSVGVADALGIEAGDTISVRNSDLKTLTVKVSALFDNHVYNYLIVDPGTIAEQWGSEPSYQIAYVCVPNGEDPHTVASSISEHDKVLNVMISEDLAAQVGDLLEGLNLIVGTIIVCAALLAIIVVYNLTNINITERIREIATIKVLGFNAKETAAYVFKENLF